MSLLLHQAVPSFTNDFKRATWNKIVFRVIIFTFWPITFNVYPSSATAAATCYWTANGPIDKS